MGCYLWLGYLSSYNVTSIDIISKKLSQHLPQKAFRSSIITNASLITDEIIHKMVTQWNVKRVQITIDGVDEDYENVKKLGKDSFDKVISIIHKLSQTDIKIDIRLNFDSRNYEQISRVIYYLSEQFGNKITVYAAKIFSDHTPNGYYDLEQESIDVTQLLHDYNLKIGKDLIPKAFTTPCMAAFPSYFTISPNGNLFKCDRKLLEKNSHWQHFQDRHGQHSPPMGRQRVYTKMQVMLHFPIMLGWMYS